MNDLRENCPVQIRFLLGPAGTGKTFQCLAEIRAELKRSPAGPPLLFIAPKQATFQIERQLLSDPELHGYTRLRILSFERFANFALHELKAPVPKLLTEDGRVMVLRALLSRKRACLQMFHATARLPGFAQQLSQLFRELQQSAITPARLQALAGRVEAASGLGRKLADLAVLFAAYREWLLEHQLEDASGLLEIATHALRHEKGESGFTLGGVWLDGFAEMTAQELALLTAALSFSPRATLAFCIDHEPREEPSWLSTWSIVAQTLRRCRVCLSALENAQIETELLSRDSARTRFSHNPTLARLEAGWTQSGSKPGESGDDAAGVQIQACANPEHEAIVAARAILEHVQTGGRFRDVAVLVRSLDGYGDTLRRVFLRYEIPFFLDRRESVAHHPLAELTRFALRTVAGHWRHEDWFGALKSGLLSIGNDELDLLENAALAHGWEGDRWFQPLAHPVAELQARLERTREEVLPPFASLQRALSSGPVTGVGLAAALRQLWKETNAQQRLEEWSQRAVALPGTSPQAHSTVWEQMNAWAENLALAFSHDALPLRDWLPIMEAGLSGLTVGAIPPALDQVLVGTIDRSRNFELKIAVLPGLNDSVFPAPPPKPVLLTEAERAALSRADAALGPSLKHRLGHERYYGYIACTRSSERLLVTYAKANSAGEPLQPSTFIWHLQQLLPGLKPQNVAIEISPADARHWCELVTPLLRTNPSSLTKHERFAAVLGQWREMRRGPTLQLAPEAVAKLYPSHLPISVSALEAFAACPFKFFVSRGLGAKERVEFEPDARHRGSFQHELLAQFHEAIVKSRRHWRDLSPGEARDLVQRLGHELIPGFEGGVFARDPAATFTAENLVENVQALAATLVTWAQHYGFEPTAAELGFGVKNAPLPAWLLALDDKRALVLRGKIDRVDLWRDGGGRARAVVMDYKSRSRQIDSVKLHHGLELQLLSYLGVVRHLRELRDYFGLHDLEPAGVFYINLSPQRASGSSRAVEGGNPYQHLGRFAGEALNLFDTRPGPTAEQFKFKRNKDGEFARKGNEALSHEQFLALMQLVEDQLREHGRRILDGVIAVDPFRKGAERACDRCEFLGICRFDSWTQNYRVLRKPIATSGEENP